MCCRWPTIPEQLISYWENLTRSPCRWGTRPARAAASMHNLGEILAFLRTRTGHNFAAYKRSTVLRRLERRMQVNDLPSLGEYRGFLRDHPPEMPALLRDLLISVTNFFRDHEALEVLEREVIPRLFATAAAGDPDPRLGRRLRHRRRGLFGGDPAPRVRRAIGRSAQVPGLCHRPRRAGDRRGARRPLSRDHRPRRQRRPGCATSSCAKGAGHRIRKEFATACSLPSMMYSKTRRSRGST